jgi:outer membrane protein
MQLMELPVSADFDIVRPDLEKELNQMREPDAVTIYEQALGIKPQIKTAELNKESALYDEKIARADLYPTVFASAGLGTGYSSAFSSQNYFSQLNNSVNPSIGISLSIPIFQKNQVKNNVKQAQIAIENADLNQINIKNQLRKNIEQACADVSSAQIQYEAGKEKFDATNESYLLAEEKFKNGLINSVDFLVIKNTSILAESDLLQSKFNLVFSYKILDFYAGIPITL